MIQQLYSLLQSEPTKNAFCIEGVCYSYENLIYRIIGIRRELKHLDTPIIGVYVANDINTYAAILAVWLEGKGYLPLHPKFPVKHNEKLITDTKIKTVLTAEKNCPFKQINVIETSHLFAEGILAPPSEISEKTLAYILFTSGSTGSPKGVPITHKSLAAFVTAFEALKLPLNNDDRFLQMFDLTFDLSIFSFLTGLLSGGCIFTVPFDGAKYLHVANLIEDEEITFAMMIPSLLKFLSVMMDDESAASLKYSFFCGEPLLQEAAEEWAGIAKAATIYNVYGPTEGTIVCSAYQYPVTDTLAKNGILSIGEPMEGNHFIIVNEQLELQVGDGNGELCIAGEQVTSGYLNNIESDTFFELNGERFYATGDLCQRIGSTYFYLGRSDSQVKIGGFRVELLEVEYRIKQLFTNANIVVIAVNNSANVTELIACFEGTKPTNDILKTSLLKELPHYMVPAQFEVLTQFPINTNGKTDRKAITNQFSK